jgi:hypothetical protein
VPVIPSLIRHSQSEQLKITLDLAADAKVYVEYEPTVSIFMLDQPAPIGATNEGIKILSQEHSENKLTIFCEVKPNKNYELGVINGELIKSINGADYKNKKLLIKNIGDEKFFVKHKIEITF